jgi:hypothetical protein
MALVEEMKPLIEERRYISTWHCIRDTFRQEGIMGMYRGMGVTMVRGFIGMTSLNCRAYLKVNAVTFYGYEWVKEWLDRE